MMVHRLLARYMAGGRSAAEPKVEEQCKHSSDMEQLAANAERSSIKYKQVEYMADHLGEEFTGVISGVTEWGLYVELDANMCEGLVQCATWPMTSTTSTNATSRSWAAATTYATGSATT